MPINDIQFLDHVIRTTGTSEHVPRCAKVRRLLAEQAERLASSEHLWGAGTPLWGAYAITPMVMAAHHPRSWFECGLCGEQPVGITSGRNLDGVRRFRLSLIACRQCRAIRWDIRELHVGRVESVRTVPAGDARLNALRLADERRAAPQRGCRRLSADYCAAREAARARWLGYPWRPWEPAPREIPNDLVSAIRRRAADTIAGLPPSGNLAAARVRPAVEHLHRPEPGPASPDLGLAERGARPGGPSLGT